MCTAIHIHIYTCTIFFSIHKRALKDLNVQLCMQKNPGYFVGSRFASNAQTFQDVKLFLVPITQPVTLFSAFPNMYVDHPNQSANDEHVFVAPRVMCLWWWTLFKEKTLKSCDFIWTVDRTTMFLRCTGSCYLDYKWMTAHHTPVTKHLYCIWYSFLLLVVIAVVAVVAVTGFVILVLRALKHR